MPWRTVLDNVCLPLLLRRGEQRMDKLSARRHAASYFEQFGLQGNADQNMEALGITAEHVVEAAKASIDEARA